LQLAVQNLEVQSSSLNRTIRLTDICFKPLAPDNDFCTIMSALNYFQNSRANIDLIKMDDFDLNAVADYISHFKICTRLEVLFSICFRGVTFAYT